MNFTENLNTKFNKTTQETAENFTWLISRLETNFKSEIADVKAINSNLEKRQTMFNETLMEISEKMEAMDDKLENFVKTEEKFSKLDQKFDNLAQNLDLMSKNLDALLKANRNNGNLEIIDRLPELDKNRKKMAENFDATLLRMVGKN